LRAIPPTVEFAGRTRLVCNFLLHRLDHLFNVTKDIMYIHPTIHKTQGVHQGCQIFRATTYQKEKMYQMDIKLSSQTH
jgi:hypothetical protein